MDLFRFFNNFFDFEHVLGVEESFHLGVKSLFLQLLDQVHGL